MFIAGKIVKQLSIIVIFYMYEQYYLFVCSPCVQLHLPPKGITFKSNQCIFMTNFMNIMQTELENMLLVLQKCIHAFWQIFRQNLYHLSYFKNKNKKTFSWNNFWSAASNFTQTLQGWGWGGGWHREDRKGVLERIGRLSELTANLLFLHQ